MALALHRAVRVVRGTRRATGAHVTADQLESGQAPGAGCPVDSSVVCGGQGRAQKHCGVVVVIVVVVYASLTSSCSFLTRTLTGMGVLLVDRVFRGVEAVRNAFQPRGQKTASPADCVADARSTTSSFGNDFC